MLARGKGHRRRRVCQSVLNRIGKVDRRDVLCGLFDRPDIEEIADEDFSAERFQAIGAFVDLAYESADADVTLEQHFSNMPACPALRAAGRRGHEYWFRHSGDPLHCRRLWYDLVPLNSIYGTEWYHVKRKRKSMNPKIKPSEEGADGLAVRKRILGAALSAFMESGYAQTSTLEIATRARVSKRELYALFGSKEAMLVACITERAQRLKAPLDLPELRDRGILSKVLTGFGIKLLDGNHRSGRRRRVPARDIRSGTRAKGGASVGIDRAQADARCIARDYGKRQVGQAFSRRSRRDGRKIRGVAVGRPDDRPDASCGRSPECRGNRATGRRRGVRIAADLSAARLAALRNFS